MAISEKDFNRRIGKALTSLKEVLASILPTVLEKQRGWSMAVSEQDVSKWIGEAIKDDYGFVTKDIDPASQIVKTVIRNVIRKKRGRVG